MGRRTISGMLCASAQHSVDWSAAYRLFERGRFDVRELFTPVRAEVCKNLRKGEPLTVLMDDTLIRKRGRSIYGTAWKRDPLGPAFHTNFIWGQRFLQLSAALPESDGPSRARGIPIDLFHCPVPSKPKRTSSYEQWAEYRRLQKIMRVSAIGLKRLHILRNALDKDPEQADRQVIVAVDGSFTNRTVCRDLPHDTTLVGRIRKDARLFLKPDSTADKGRGRRRWYGDPMPSPEKIRQDPMIPWTTVLAWGAGKLQRFEVKTIAPIRWQGTGNKDIRLIVIRPLAYRPKKGSRLLYRKPAYLICTDPTLPLGQVIQSFVWRWEIELNFRDEKTVLGVGEAQVRTKTAAENVPAFIVAAYALLLLAARKTGKKSILLPTPKWRKTTTNERPSTPRLIAELRAQLWGKALGLNLTHVVNDKMDASTLPKINNTLSAAVCFAFR